MHAKALTSPVHLLCRCAKPPSWYTTPGTEVVAWLDRRLNKGCEVREHDAKVKVRFVYCAVLDGLKGAQGVRTQVRSKSEQRLQSLKTRFGYRFSFKLV